MAFMMAHIPPLNREVKISFIVDLLVGERFYAGTVFSGQLNAVPVLYTRLLRHKIDKPGANIQKLDKSVKFD